jgi:hypothetical protein
LTLDSVVVFKFRSYSSVGGVIILKLIDLFKPDGIPVPEKVVPGLVFKKVF